MMEMTMMMTMTQNNENCTAIPQANRAPKMTYKRYKQYRKEMCDDIGYNATPIWIFALLVIALTIIVLSGSRNSEIELRVMTSECITVQEKRISGSGYSLVLSNGEETYNLPVSETIYNSYHPGDSYRHDADQKDYANLSD